MQDLMIHSGHLPNVPALFFCAAITGNWDPPISATGVGMTVDDAAARCRGEMAERKALQGVDTGALFGAASAETRPVARTRALHEFNERIHAHRWWTGHAPAQPLTDVDVECWRQFHETHPRLIERRDGIVRINGNAELHVYAAWSCATGGKDVSIGTACRADRKGAITAALTELYQMEFGAEIIRHRALHGAPLEKREQRMRARSETLTVDALDPLITSPGLPVSSAPGSANDPSIQPDIDAVSVVYFQHDGYEVALARNRRAKLPVRRSMAPCWPLY